MNNKLLIKNFGPIKKADITISPLTILIGPNSSGKSYSALLIHSILNSFNNLGLNLYELIRQDSVKRFLKNDDDIVDVPPHLEELLKNAVISRAMLNSIASESDENYSAYKKQSEIAYRLLVKYAKGVGVEKGIKI